MDATACHRLPPVQIIRDQRGLKLGRIDRQTMTGRYIARDAAGLVVATFDPREGATRTAAGLIIARGNVLAAFLLRP